MDIQKIASFEITKRQTSYVLLVIFITYIALTSFELFQLECTGYRNCFDFDRRMARLYVWDLTWIDDDYRHFVHMGLLEVSQVIFGNYKVLPFVSSILILAFTYKLVYSITQKRIASVIAVLVTLQSSIFFNYDTSLTYPSFWSLFFILSLYLTRTKFYLLSPLFFILSLVAKLITAVFLPALLLFVLLDKNPRKVFYTIVDRKFSSLIILYLIVIAIGLFGIFVVRPSKLILLVGFLDRFNSEQFFWGFVSWIWKGFAHDQLTVVFLIFATAIILMKKIRQGYPALALCYGIILTSPFLIGMTSFDVWPYRFVPLITGISLLVGILVANFDKWIGSFKFNR